LIERAMTVNDGLRLSATMSTIRYIVLACVCAIGAAAGAAAQTVRVPAGIPSEALSMPTWGDLPSERTLSLEIWFKPRKQKQLESLIAELQDPSSPRYHKWLSADEYTRRFGVTQAQFDKLARWLGDQGMQVTGGSPSEGLIRFRGGPLAVLRAFGSRIMRFSPDGSRFGNISDPKLPGEFAELVGGITGLDNMYAVAPASLRVSRAAAPAKPRLALRSGGSVRPRSPIELADLDIAPNVMVDGEGPALGPSDFDVFYNAKPLKDQGITGAGGGCIAVISDSDFSASSVQAFDNQFGLPDNTASITRISGFGSGGNFAETELDLEWSHAVAPGAAQKYALSSDIVSALNDAVRDNTCSVITISFTLCRRGESFYTSTVHSIASRAAAQGQTILVASGDWGAARIDFDPFRGCVVGTSPGVNELASDPFITSVGGTAFNRSAFSGQGGTIVSYTTERTWNDVSDGVGGGATGGGKSAFFSKPSYQSGVSPNDGRRDQPDIAMVASPNFPGAFFYDSSGAGPDLGIVGGTSISAPMWAGIVKLLEQKAGGRVGPLNSRLYSLARAGQSQGGFHDITTGNNDFSGVQGFDAGPGYDLVTGWGTVDVTRFINAFIQGPSHVDAALKANKTSLNFGNVKAGKSKRKSIKLSNSAAKKSAISITFEGASISGSDAFSLSNGCTGALAPKRACIVSVTFHPTSPGTQTATLTINSNASNGPTNRFSLTGTGK
jgi:subtilase family serine protease